ncbi:GNAT family N-acetyltransferase [Alishewanella aestuarii]|uniref:GNAT family N-acetyltransferase n=1 Tax=Alishewanella aestuarii TaxID=453835 RepID=UPI000586CA6F|nr:GNAT family N-acetyltransferase [Alishewanella aestuarii]
MLSLKSIRLRLVEPSDAEFILKLRLDERYNNFLSKVDNDIESQRRWIINYKKDEADKRQFYFIIERQDGTPCGTVRIYDLKADSFCWGSWILNEHKTRYAAIESALLVYQYGFDFLGFRKCHFDVMKGNSKVADFHKKFGAIIVSEDNDNHYFEITKESVDKMAVKFKDLIG